MVKGKGFGIAGAIIAILYGLILVSSIDSLKTTFHQIYTESGVFTSSEIDQIMGLLVSIIQVYSVFGFIFGILSLIFVFVAKPNNARGFGTGLLIMGIVGIFVTNLFTGIFLIVSGVQMRNTIVYEEEDLRNPYMNQ